MKKNILFSLAVLLGGCSIFPYQPEFSQGNILTDDKVQTIHTGMTKDQVRLVLGDPVMSNTFKKNEWNYIYTIQKGRYIKKSKKIIVIFDGDRVSQIQTDSHS